MQSGASALYMCWHLTLFEQLLKLIQLIQMR